MDRALKFTAACLLFASQVPAVFAEEQTPPAAAPATPPAAVAPPAAVVPPAVNVIRIGDQTEIQIAAPAGQIQAQLVPGNSRVRFTDRRGMTVDLSQPPAGAPGEQPPQLKDLLMKSLFQALANHRSVRVGRMQIDVQTPPQSAPATAVPDAKLDLGTPATPEDEEDAQSAVPSTPPKVQILRAPADAPLSPPSAQPAPAPKPARTTSAPPAELKAEALPATRVELRKPVQARVVPVQALEPAAEPVLPRAVPSTTPVEAAVPPKELPSIRGSGTAELEAVQKELARLSDDLKELSRKRSVKGKVLQDLVRRIADANEHLEAARKKLAP